MIPEEYQKSNLALELKAGKKRLEDALHVLSDGQCERARGTRSGSVMDVLLELVATEFFGADGSLRSAAGIADESFGKCGWRMPIASGTEQPTENKSVENLVAEFLECCVMRSTGMSPMAITTTRNSLSVRVSP